MTAWSELGSQRRRHIPTENATLKGGFRSADASAAVNGGATGCQSRTRWDMRDSYSLKMPPKLELDC